MKTCPICQKELEEEIVVCDVCGYTFDTEEEQVVESEYEAPDEMQIEIDTESEVEIEMKEKGRNTALISIICFAIITALGLALALGSWFFVKPKYDEAVSGAQTDMANYGVYYSAYQMSMDDENAANTYVYGAQMAAQSFEIHNKKAESLSYYLYGAFLLSGILIAVGGTSLCFLLSKKKKDKEIETEEYNGEFGTLIEEVKEEEQKLEDEINEQLILVEETAGETIETEEE